ncbi:MAG TPA: TonB-dependent receptor [Allosphingosinicella sp.]|nr:TonB-dependent receptor [Allosphingosinicella sp.]
MKKYILLGAVSALAIPSAAFAQTSGQQQMDQQTIVVTGNRNPAVDGVQVPKTTKAKEVLTSEFIQHQTPGQSIDDVINMLPGVSFQNNDPYGSSGGTLTIRGFDNTRISQTFDGLPLNDSGNYALFSGEQLDPELINQVNVNLGTTDLDSPTASATGSTVNYTSRNPTDDFHVRLQSSVGSYDYFRMFGLIDTGTFTSIGTKAWLAASHEENTNPFQRTSSTDKYQYNGKIYQPIGSHGDFIWLGINWNHNINGNFSSVPLRTDLTQDDTVNTNPRVVGSGSGNRFPLTKAERNYTLAPCQVAQGHFGKADSPNTCGTAFDYSFNPSDNGNIRMNSRFTLADNLFLTVDAGYQFVKANGGSSAVRGNEGFASSKGTGGNTQTATGLVGFVGGQAFFGGVDLNGDGDTLDGVEVYAPSHTETHRLDFVADLLYNIAPDQTIRINYSYDRGRHRQTGEVGPLGPDGHAIYVYPIDHPMTDANGNILEKRDRLSYAILHQVSGEYRGGFFDDKLTIDIGARAPFFTRNLNNFCVTESNGTFVDCFNGDPAAQAAFLAVHPDYTPPEHREFHYSKLLPQAGLTFDFTRNIGIFANYSRGLQVPSTDSLYQFLGLPAGTATPVPEITDNFDTGIRYRSSKVQAQLTGWYTIFTNRLASAFDPILNITVFRNLGTVHKYGLDANVAYQVTPNLSLIGFGSYLKSKIINNLQQGECVAADVTQHTNGCTTVGQPIFALTAGKRESGAPTYTFGGRIQGDFGPVQFGVQAKRTGPRFVNDQNLPIFQCTTSARNLDCTNGGRAFMVYGAKAPAYTTVDLDARLSLKWAGFNDRTYLQVNVTNLFDKLYVAGFGGSTSQFSVPFAFIGAPRAISGTLVVGF